ncbi:MAG: hypothetical protein EOM83_02875 [Clostridia bacterium]|nr:hypothetical protein [Clostridia bacterium]
MKILRHIFLTAFFAALTLTTFGQIPLPIFSEYSEGSSNNKYIEIYNPTEYTVDMTSFTVRLGSNGGAWGNTYSFGSVQLAAGDVFVIANSGSDPIILAEADATSTVTYFNGNDALGLFKDGVLIDVIGIQGEDPGTAWPVAGITNATGEHTLVRKANICSPTTDWALSAGTNADDSQWIVLAQNDWTNLGFHISECQGGTTVAAPDFTPGSGTYSNPVSVTITSDTPDADIYYTTDGSDPTQQSTLYTLPLTISQTTTLKAKGFLDGYNPSYITTAQYVFPETVTTLAALRAGLPGHLYHYTGTALLTFQQTFRNQKYLQDATAGILIDDVNGIITSDFEIGDGISNLWGQVAEFGGMMQLTPTQDPGDPVSSGNYPAPQVITLTDLVTNFDTYESELVRINGVTFADAGATFANGLIYPITGPAAVEYDFRTTFYDVDYIGTTIPTVPVDIIGLPNARTDGNYLTARSSADLIENLVPPSIQVTSPNGGEVWQKGETYNITWLNLNFTGNVKITITKPPFTNIVLADNLVNTGSYQWTIPTTFAIGSSYKIKVQGVNASDPLDVSDANFSVIEPLPDPDIVINEIMYNPSGDLGNDADYEYLELYNNSGFAVDLGGWSLANAITYTFGTGTTIADGGYLVIALKPDTIISHYGISNVVGSFTGGLNNTGEAIVLLNPQGATADSVTYADGGLWPTEPDGFGPSLELLDPSLDNSLPENWAASLVNDGTPGVANSVFGTELLTLTAPNGGETFEQGSSQEVTWTYLGFTGTIKIELTDIQLTTTVTLAQNVPVEYGVWDWEIPADLTTSDNYKIVISETTDGMPMDESDDVFSIVGTIVPAITVTSPNGGEAWTQGTLHNITWTNEFVTGDVMIELSDGMGTILLEDSIAAADGTFGWNIPADQTIGSNYTILVSGMDQGAPSDVSDAPFSIVEPQPVADIIINEIMYNTPSVDNEWCELYNREAVTVSLEGYYLLDDNDAAVPVVIPAGYEIAPGGYFTIALELLAPPLFFTPDFVGNPLWSLGNGGDNLRLFDPSGQLVNNVAYEDGAPWPTAPDGNGPSLSLLDVALDNSVPENWAASAQDNGTPGAVNFGTEPLLTVTNPNGGEQITQATNYTITWTYANYEGTVKVQLMEDASPVAVLGYAPVADMQFLWDVSQAAGANYAILISDSLTGTPFDESDAAFAIIPPAQLADLVINEIMYNGPEGGTDTTEFIEIYNRGALAVNLENYYFSQGVEFVFPDYELAPGGYVVVAYRANVMLNQFGIVALQWTGGGLSNSGEAIELMNNAGQQVDIVNFDDGGVWPVAPDGFGPSLALIDADADNNDGNNWKPETTYAFANTENMAVYATPGAANFATPGQGILLKAGWSGISTYLDLNNQSVETNMQPIVGELLGMQNFSQVYLPGNGVNTIGNWNPDKGYQINLTSQRYLVLYGTPSADHTAELTTGWNGLPVLSACAVDAAALFGPHAEIVVVTEMGSNKTYWPALNIYTLQTLQPGSAYFIKVSAPVNLIYPDCGGK